MFSVSSRDLRRADIGVVRVVRNRDSPFNRGNVKAVAVRQLARQVGGERLHDRHFFKLDQQSRRP